MGCCGVADGPPIGVWVRVMMYWKSLPASVAGIFNFDGINPGRGGKKIP
jgi:hypothetical protein